MIIRSLANPVKKYSRQGESVANLSTIFYNGFTRK